MFGWIRSIGRAFADPFTGDALVANSEFVSIPKEESVTSTLRKSLWKRSVRSSQLGSQMTLLRQDRMRRRVSFLSGLATLGLVVHLSWETLTQLPHPVMTPRSTVELIVMIIAAAVCLTTDR